MLERATICSKYGARHVQALSVKLTRSRRLLHNAFWAHGAGDINLPFWWLDLLHRPPCDRPSFVKTLARTARYYIPTILNSGFLLEFLYPSKSLSLARRFLTRELVPIDHLFKSHQVNYGLQKYSDLATQQVMQDVTEEGTTEETGNDQSPNNFNIESVNGVLLHDEEDGLDTAVGKALERYGGIEDVPEPSKTFQSRLDNVSLSDLSQNRIWYGRIIQKLKDMPEYGANVESLNEGQSRVLTAQLKMAQYQAWRLASMYLHYGKSSQFSADYKDWSPLQFISTIKAAYIARPSQHLFRLVDPGVGRNEVLYLWKEAMKHKSGSLVLAAVLDLTLSFRDWELGSLVYDYIRGQDDNSLFQASLVELDLDFLGHSILSIAYSFYRASADLTMAGTSRSRRLRDSRRNYFPHLASNLIGPFMLAMIEWFYKQPLTLNFDLALAQKVWKALLRVTHPPKASFYQLAIQQSLSVIGSPSETSKFTANAFALFEQARSSEDFALGREDLQRLLSRLIEIHHPGAQTVFEFLRTQSENIPAGLRRAMLQELAFQGEPEQFKQLLSQSGFPDEQQSLQTTAQLITALGRKPDIVGAQQTFDALLSKYGRQPSVQCWNAIIAACLQSDDVPAALSYFDQMQKAGTSPSIETNKLILQAHCGRGDVSTASAFVEDLMEKGQTVNTKMTELLVLAHTQVGDLDSAENLLIDVMERDVPGDKTTIWNTLLYAHAVQKNMDDLNFLHERMISERVPENEMTYAALIQGFTACRRPDLGTKVINTIMPSKNLVPTTFHYNIVMLGYLARGEYSIIFDLTRKMRAKGVKLDYSTKILLVRAAVEQNTRDSCRGQDAHQEELTKISMDSAEKLLDYILQSESLSDLSPDQYQFGKRQQPLHEVYAANYFDSLIFAYAEQNSLDKVSELFDRYVTLHKTRFPHKAVSPPMRMLAALMVAHRNQNKFDKVEQCWNTAYAKAQNIASRTGVPPTEGETNWVTPSRRYLLHLPLQHYMYSLISSGRQSDLRELINSLLSAGFALDSKNWNVYIQTLSLSGEQVEAFALCEEHLIEGFPGWPRLTGRKSPARLMLQQARDKHNLNRMGPTYRTIVVLAAGYMDLRSKYAFEGAARDQVLGELNERAPRTMRAISYMPRMDDDEQLRYMRGR